GMKQTMFANSIPEAEYYLLLKLPWPSALESKFNCMIMVERIPSVGLMILEDLGSIIDNGLSEVVLGKPFAQTSKLTYDESLGLIRFAQKDDEVVFRMPQRTKELDLVSPLEKDKFEAFFVDSLKVIFDERSLKFLGISLMIPENDCLRKPAFVCIAVDMSRETCSEVKLCGEVKLCRESWTSSLVEEDGGVVVELMGIGLHLYITTTMVCRHLHATVPPLPSCSRSAFTFTTDPTLAPPPLFISLLNT
ncbi:hypothetical protein Tco_0787512, partial [Tanacetum coccineum]